MYQEQPQQAPPPDCHLAQNESPGRQLADSADWQSVGVLVPPRPDHCSTCASLPPSVQATHRQCPARQTRSRLAERIAMIFCAMREWMHCSPCLLYTSDAADEEDSVDLGGRRIIKKKNKRKKRKSIEKKKEIH
eukprot:TRINITY_DN51997_c0_g1_i2.p1 TRINITY_DN51997_c0_g1~~TRINITY_DN51997_c0_g1_i2.p1  ORF type:complete len:134 (-),score=12.15 TRINITY_DN51997_c0_g1_i2:26-427(-)